MIKVDVTCARQENFLPAVISASVAQQDPFQLPPALLRAHLVDLAMLPTQLQPSAFLAWPVKCHRMGSVAKNAHPDLFPPHRGHPFAKSVHWAMVIRPIPQFAPLVKWEKHHQ